MLTRGDRPGVEHVGWRVGSAEELVEAESRLRELGVPFHWSESGTEPGQGDGLRFLTPAGLPFELYWEVERFVAPPERDSRLRSHPERFGMHGIAPRRFDHVNFLVDDVATEQAWLTEHLGIHHRYFAESSSGARMGSWLSRTNVSHEIAVMRNRNQTGALLHHHAYFLDSPDQLLRAATILAENGVTIEWGPGQHGTSGAIFLYCFDPAGIRLEVWTGGMLIFAPDWEASPLGSRGQQHRDGALGVVDAGELPGAGHRDRRERAGSGVSDLVAAGRALAATGLVTAFGHVSARSGSESALITPPKPLGSLADDEPLLELSLGGRRCRRACPARPGSTGRSTAPGRT
jgi:catechol 2,3-dioxygenase-like lactoylglutathione lyase family enzyme